MAVLGEAAAASQDDVVDKAAAGIGVELGAEHAVVIVAEIMGAILPGSSLVQRTGRGQIARVLTVRIKGEES